LESHLTRIVRERDPYLASGGHLYVREYIRSHLSKFGEVETHEFDVRWNKHQNLILKIPEFSNQFLQESKQKSPILIGAHYDSAIGCVGADDNATGIAVLLELASSFGTNPAQYPINLIAFDMEEYGLLGSRAYAEQLKRQKQKLRLMISLEMLGYCDCTPNSQYYPFGLKHFYPNTGDFIGLIGNIPAIGDLISLSNQMNISLPCQFLPAGWRGLIVPDTRRSDHAPFWDSGFKAIMVTDTANIRNPHYHLSSDRLETLDLEFLTSVCQGLIVGISHIS
jgi:aminopeptidase YwaD